jgi:RNA polymerase sigma-70 factor (ECF subfamily)
MMLEHFQSLVEQHQDRVFTLSCYLLGDREEAADATQEVLLRLWRNLGGLDDDGGVAAWLTRVTRNYCFDQLRKRRSQKNALGDEQEPEVFELTAGDDPSPEHRAATSDLGRHLQRAIRELSEPYRSVLILREVQEMKYKEISEALEMPINTVKVNIHRGRRMLRDRLRGVMGHAAAC